MVRIVCLQVNPPRKGDSDFQLRSRKLNCAADMLQDNLRSKARRIEWQPEVFTSSSSSWHLTSSYSWHLHLLLAPPPPPGISTFSSSWHLYLFLLLASPHPIVPTAQSDIGYSTAVRKTSVLVANHPCIVPPCG